MQRRFTHSMAGKHVLCEKPVARNAKEAFEILKASTESKQVKVGSNHRYFSSEC